MYFVTVCSPPSSSARETRQILENSVSQENCVSKRLQDGFRRQLLNAEMTLRAPNSPERKEYCMKHWEEDWLFGYQCLNGSNPRMIQRCKTLPQNFPVTAGMVQRSMADGTTLNKELKAGNIYLLDYAIMEGIPTNTIKGMVNLYYQTDRDVQQDAELQAWIRDVTQEGFTELPNLGLKSKLSSREELSTLLAVIIFTTTAQHAATNNGQFDWCAWVPNTPCTMRLPPPTDKEAVTMEMIMATLPDVSQSCVQMAITWHLGRAQPDAIPLGQYPEQHFTEGRALEMIDSFRKELKKIEEHILDQSAGLDLQYLFLLPSRIENSITI